MDFPVFCYEELNLKHPVVQEKLKPYIDSVTHAIENGLGAAVEHIKVTSTAIRGHILHPKTLPVFGHSRPGYLRLPGTPMLPDVIEVALPAGLYDELVRVGAEDDE